LRLDITMSPAIQTDNREVERDEPVKNGAAPDDIVLWVENHLESWRQLMHFIGVARGQKFDGTDEDQFLELKGVIVQELEMILASAGCNSPLRDDVHELMNNIPSLRQVSRVNEGALHTVEHQWHLIYIGWHAALGQLKVKHKTPGLLHPGSGLLHRWLSR